MIDYIMQHLWQLWAAVALICLILELTAGDFFIICFAIGAVPAAIVAAIGAGTYYQIVVFAVVTLVSLFYVRPFAKRYLHKGEDKRISNADALLGRQGGGSCPGWRFRTCADRWRHLESRNQERYRHPRGCQRGSGRSCFYHHYGGENVKMQKCKNWKIKE